MASSNKGREIGALDLVVATLLDKYRENKLYFDFGISIENNGACLNEGLIAQKESFGGRVCVYESWGI